MIFARHTHHGSYVDFVEDAYLCTTAGHGLQGVRSHAHSSAGLQFQGSGMHWSGTADEMNPAWLHRQNPRNYVSIVYHIHIYVYIYMYICM